MTLNRDRFDWKFWLSTAVGIIGLAISVGIPYLLWKADLQSKSISLQILSSTLLQVANGPINGLQISLDGTVIDPAYLTIFEIKNDGDKPVTASDFESPIIVKGGENIKILKSQVAERAPANLPIQIETLDADLKISPLLLNPGDKFNLVVVSTGASPTWTPTARIAGIKEIKVEKQTPHKPPRLALTWLILATSFVFFCIFLVGYGYPRAKRSDSLMLLSVTIGLAIIGGCSLNLLTIEYGFRIDMPKWALIPLTVFSLFTTALAIHFLYRATQIFEQKRQRRLQRLNRL